MVTRVSSSWVTSRDAVNEVRRLLEKNAQIVQEIDGGSDFGEDLMVTITEEGIRTGDRILVQVKGGVSFRKRSRGYSVPVRKHRSDWISSAVPVICVVWDPEIRKIFWVNATEQLRESAPSTRSVSIAEDAVLDDHSIGVVLALWRAYITKSVVLPKTEIRGFWRHRNTRNNGGVDGSIGGVPNRIFEPVSVWIEGNLKLLNRILVGAVLLLISSALALMWPTLWWFAEPYMGDSTWIWIFMIFGFTGICIRVSFSEVRAGRGGRIPAVLSYAYLIPVYMVAIGIKFEIVNISDEVRAVIVASGTQLVKFAMLGFFAVYVSRERSRRRRVRAAYGSVEPRLASSSDGGGVN